VPAEAYLALDLGTSHLGCLLADGTGRILASVSRSWSFPRDPEGGSLARKLEPDATFQALGELCRQALAQAGVPKAAVAGVACAAQREGCVFLDSQGREVYAGPNFDLRAALEGMACDAQHGDEIYRSTGHLPSLMFAPARLCWLREHRPAEADKVATILGLADWLGFRLTGQRRCEYTSACEIGLLDVPSLTWSEAALRRWKIEGRLLPPLGRAGGGLGAITKQAAAVLGLTPGTPVALGCADTQAALLGLGVLEPGQAGIVAGWSIPFQRVLDRPFIDAEARTWSGVHPLPGRWVLESNAAESGNAFRWAVDTLVGPRGYKKAEALASLVPPGAEGALALLGPPIFSARKTSLRLGGVLFPVPFTAGEPTPGALLRAALEAIGYTVRANLEQIEAIAGPVKEVSLGGGLARSRLAAQIISACLGRPVQAGYPDASLLGAAALALAVGAPTNVRTACAALAQPLRKVEPERSWTAAYREGFPRWLRAAKVIEELGQEVL
jgi:sugar (pentulose or hexulose) kinase